METLLKLQSQFWKIKKKKKKKKEKKKRIISVSSLIQNNFSFHFWCKVISALTTESIQSHFYYYTKEA